jgi:hypothetical protein
MSVITVKTRITTLENKKNKVKKINKKTIYGNENR